MSTHVEVRLPTAVRTPRGARWVGQLIDVIQAFSRAWSETQKIRVRERNAAWVRDYANRIAATDPGMAADLRAAVDRELG